MRCLPALLLTALLLCAATAGCGSTAPPRDHAAPQPTLVTPSSPPTAPPATPTRTPTARPGTVPPSWLGKRPLPLTASGFGVQKPTPPELRVRRFTLPDTVPMLPGTGFAARITDPAPRSVIRRSTWQRGCPVRAADLAWIRLTFRGFDGDRHTGELLVNGAVAHDLVTVFHQLWDHRFPIEQMRITGRSARHARPTGDGNDTVAFNCRAVRDAKVYSQHAYGLAVDVNPFQNPYIKDGLVLPELAGAYTNRSWRRPGMILPGGVVVHAFRSIGWTWGGSWHSLKDLQHFSANGG